MSHLDHGSSEDKGRLESSQVMVRTQDEALEEPRHRTMDDFYEEVHRIPSSSSNRSYLFWLCYCCWVRRRYLLIVLAVAYGLVADELDHSAMNVIVADDRFRHDILHDNLQHGADTYIAVSIGSFVGRIVCGRFMDHTSPRWGGLKRTYTFGLFLGLVANVGTAVSPNLPLLLILQVMSGYGSALTFAGGSVLLLEIFPPSCRGTYKAVSDFCWSMYSSIMAVLLLQNQDNNNVVGGEDDGTERHLALSAVTSAAGWRLYALAISLPNLIALLVPICFVPESPRYLVLSERCEEATHVANSIGLAMRGGIRTNARNRGDTASLFSTK